MTVIVYAMAAPHNAATVEVAGRVSAYAFASTGLVAITAFVVAAATAVVVSVAALMPTPAEAGTNAGNDNHRRDATTILRQSVDGAWSYVGCFAEALRGPVRGDFQ